MSEIPVDKRFKPNQSSVVKYQPPRISVFTIFFQLGHCSCQKPCLVCKRTRTAKPRKSRLIHKDRKQRKGSDYPDNSAIQKMPPHDQNVLSVDNDKKDNKDWYKNPLTMISVQRKAKQECRKKEHTFIDESLKETVRCKNIKCHAEICLKGNS